ncbi:uncharacterized protein SCDLUD_000359 [Saccharomycodes ludwigii]|uniref:uncharacterized protein n=1 Tax=Saccharomycodes ludwigii TaxID=36035 RepID=UPI001E8424A7|nr:hypothetical protein SCDLUD_000359 [Saccharomycodes ludwigii]KAH3902770.1 hypothetical protein SCDLUD_000359 [Saccharomycodes ludwigii]
MPYQAATILPIRSVTDNKTIKPIKGCTKPNSFASDTSKVTSAPKNHLSSLSFLHKPKRNRPIRDQMLEDEKLLSLNTELNKIIKQKKNEDIDKGETYYKPSNAKLDNFNIKYFDTTFLGDDEIGPKNEATDIYTSTFDDDDKENAIDDLNDSIKDFRPFNNRSKDDTNERLNIIRKKSGEIVKSNLKRSKSLPIGRSVSAGDNSISQPNHHGRSNSVHFEESRQVKYFDELEAPCNLKNNTNQNTSRRKSKKFMSTAAANTNKPQFGISQSESNNEYATNNSTPSFLKFTGLDCSLLESLSPMSEINIDFCKQLMCNKHVFPLTLQIDMEYTSGGAPFYKLSGFIVVQNMFYDKQVIFRYTINGWLTWKDLQCKWFKHCDDDDVLLSDYDIFQFELPDIDKIVQDTNVLQFCLEYKSWNKGGVEHVFWDNNDSNNYTLKFSSGKQKNIYYPQ